MKDFGDQRGLRAVHHVVRDQRQHDRDEDHHHRAGAEQAEIDEPEHAGGYGADRVHPLAADAIGQMSEKWDREKRQHRGAQNGGQQEVSRDLERADAIGEHEGGEDIERCLLGHAGEGAENDLLRLPFDHLEDRGFLDLLFKHELGEHRRFHDSQADPEADPDQDQTQEKGHAPAPGQELIARHRAEGEHRQIGEEQPAGYAELRPRRDEAARVVGFAPFHRHQHRPAPFAADADALDEAQHGEDDRPPDADLVIGRHQCDQEGRDAHEHQGDDQRGLAADAIAIVAEDGRANRACQEAHEVDAEGVERAGQRVDRRGRTTSQTPGR